MYFNSKSANPSQLSYQRDHLLSKLTKQDKYINNTQQQTRQITFLSQQSQQFSFNNRLTTDPTKISIRLDLCKLTKDDLIQIIMQQIQQNKLLRIKIKGFQDQHKIINSLREDSDIFDSLNQSTTMAKYKQLNNYMQQYITNTNQAHHYFTNLITQLKHQNKLLKQQNINIKQQLKLINQLSIHHQSQNHQSIIKQYLNTIKNLQDSVTNYIQINNQCTKKYQKLKKTYQLLQKQLQNTNQSHHKNPNKQSQQSIQPKKLLPKPKQKQSINSSSQQLLQKIKLLQIQNNQLKQSYFILEKILQKKSQKIRKLLQDIDKITQQKWEFKQKYMELKSKSYITQSTNKNYSSDSLQNQQNAKNLQH